MFQFFGHFSQFEGKFFQVFPGHFKAPTDLPRFPAGFSCPTRSTLTSPRPRKVTSPLSWQQWGNNFCLLSYSKNGPFRIPEGPRTLPVDPISLKTAHIHFPIPARHIRSGLGAKKRVSIWGIIYCIYRSRNALSLINIATQNCCSLL